MDNANGVNNSTQPFRFCFAHRCTCSPCKWKGSVVAFWSLWSLSGSPSPLWLLLLSITLFASWEAKGGAASKGRRGFASTLPRVNSCSHIVHLPPAWVPLIHDPLLLFKWSFKNITLLITFCCDILHWFQEPPQLRAKHNGCGAWGVLAFPRSPGLSPTAVQTPGPMPHTPDTSSQSPCVSTSSCFLPLYVFSFLYLKCTFLLNQHRKLLLFHKTLPVRGQRPPYLTHYCAQLAPSLLWGIPCPTPYSWDVR